MQHDGPEFMQSFTTTIVYFYHGEWREQKLSLRACYCKPHVIRYLLQKAMQEYIETTGIKWKTCDGTTVVRFDRCSFYHAVKHSQFQLIPSTLYRRWSKRFCSFMRDWMIRMLHTTQVPLSEKEMEKQAEESERIQKRLKWIQWQRDHPVLYEPISGQWQNYRPKLVICFSTRRSRHWFFHRWNDHDNKRRKKQQKLRGWTRHELHKWYLAHPKPCDEWLWLFPSKYRIVEILIVIFFISQLYINRTHSCGFLMLYQPKKHNH